MSELGWWTTVAEFAAAESLQVAEPRSRAGDDFSIQGSILVLANALSFVAEPLHQAQISLGKLRAGDNSAALNGYIYVATVLLQSILDGVASLAQKIQKLPGQQDIYFKSYQFIRAEVVWIQPIQKRLRELRYADKTFFQCADALKHEHPWVGSVSERQPDGVLDVYPHSSPQSIGFVYGILDPIYKEVKGIVCRLAKSYGEPEPQFPM